MPDAGQRDLVPGIEDRNAEQVKILHIPRDQDEAMLQSCRCDQSIGHA